MDKPFSKYLFSKAKITRFEKTIFELQYRKFSKLPIKTKLRIFTELLVNPRLKFVPSALELVFAYFSYARICEKEELACSRHFDFSKCESETSKSSIFNELRGYTNYKLAIRFNFTTYLTRVLCRLIEAVLYL